MKKIELTGGLGNQMFQYAIGRNKEISGKKIVFLKNFSENRHFSLDKFRIKTKANFENKKHCKLSTAINKIKMYLNLDFNKYYQNEEYFKNIEHSIRDEFTIKEPLSSIAIGWKEKIISSPLSVSIHIRRGDYVSNLTTNRYHGLCDIKYYQKAIGKIENMLNKNFDIFVFSDDIGWAKNNLFCTQKVNFVSSPVIPDYEEMYLMRLCNHNIIANSTFSWWGAWLNMNPSKIVIGPKKWFSNRKNNIMPIDWIKI